jgi:hypothetical protein
VDEEIRGGRWAASQPTIGTIRADGRPIPTITKKLAYLFALVFGCNIANFYLSSD